MDTDALRAAYASDDVVRAVCDEMAGRERNQSETKLARIIARLRRNGSSARRHQVIAAFRTLEGCSCGQYVEGRHGWPSRFVWSVGSLNACMIAQGAEASLETLPEEVGVDEDVDVELEAVTHSFRLRSDFTVEFQLPPDLTEREAQRFANFVSSLPVEI